MEEQKCLRNMSCTCKLCAGEDIAELLSISRSIKSNIAYQDGNEDNAEVSVPPPPPPSTTKSNFVANSPPVSKKSPVEPEQMTISEPNVPNMTAKDDNTSEDSRPIATRLQDKNWKIRKQAYEDLKIEVDAGGDCIAYLSFLGKIAVDSNASALESGLDVILSFSTSVSAAEAKKIAEDVLPKVIDKGLSGRVGAVKLSEGIAHALVEAGAGEETTISLVDGVKNRKPKVPPACIDILEKLLKSFGPKVIPFSQIKPHLVKFCESTVKNVRPAAMRLIVEIYRWTGPTLLTDVIDKLRQAQLTEYQDSIKDITPGEAKPTGTVKGQNTNQSSAESSSSTSFDPRDLAEEVNLLDKIPKTEFKTKLALPKWSEKVAALEILLDIIGPVPKLAQGEYGELIGTLKQLTNDSNVQVVAKSIAVMGALADGLRRSFSMYGRMLYPMLFRKLSDKKAVVLSAVNQALDKIQEFCIPMESMMEDVRDGCNSNKNKVPQARVQLLSFIQRCTDNKKIPVDDSSLIGELGRIVALSIDETDPKVRSAAVETFASLIKSSPSARDFLKESLSKVQTSQPRSYKKIEELTGISSSKVSENPQRSNAPPKTAPPAKTKLGVSRSKPSSSKAAPKSTPASRSTSTGKAASISNGTSTPSASIIESTMTYESAVEFMGNMEYDIDMLLQKLKSTKWKERQEAIDGLSKHVSENLRDQVSEFAEPIVIVLSANTKDFKDSNINVLKSAFSAIKVVGQFAEGKFPRSIVTKIVKPAVDKFSDRKTKESINDLLLVLAEAVGPVYLMQCIFQHAVQVKSPAVLEEIVNFVAACVTDFGSSSCGLRIVLNYVLGKQALQSSNPKVRTASIKLLGVLYSQVGPQIQDMSDMSSLKGSLISSIESEFKRVGYDPSTAQNSIKRKVKSAEAVSDLESSSGRVDISSKLTKDLLHQMNTEADKASWKLRLAAMESVQKICKEAGMNIEVTKTVAELCRSLKARLADSNANLKVKAAQTIGIVASALGVGVAKVAKFIVPQLMLCVGDNRKVMQTAAIEALDNIVFHEGKTSPICMETTLVPLSTAMGNPVGRPELLSWASRHLQDFKGDMLCLVSSTIGCLQDRTSEGREKAQLVLTIVTQSVGKDVILSNTRDIKPATRRAIQPMLDLAFQQCVSTPMDEIVNTSQNIQLQAPSSRPTKRDSPPPKSEPIKKTPHKRTGIKPPASVSSMTNAPESQEEIAMIANSEKMLRLERVRRSKWIFEDPSEIVERSKQLEAQWSPYLTSALRCKLFAPSYDKGMMEAMSDLSACIDKQIDVCIDNLDLILKWVTLRIVDNNVQALGKMLEVLVKLLETLRIHNYELHEVEASIFLPYLLHESGQQKIRFRVKFREAMKILIDLFPASKYSQYLVDCFASKNTRSKCECIGIVGYLVETQGLNALGRKGIRELGKCVEASEKDVRESAITSLMEIYKKCFADASKFYRLTSINSQKSIDLLNARIKHLNISSVKNPPEEPHQNDSLTRSDVEHDEEQPIVSSQLEQVTSDSSIKENTLLNNRTDLPEPESQLQGENENKEEVKVSIPSRESMRDAVLKRIDDLLLQENKIVHLSSPKYVQGKEAMKLLYTMMSSDHTRAEDDLEFLESNINGILQRLTAVFRASFGVDIDDEIDVYILSVCLSALQSVVQSASFRLINDESLKDLLMESCKRLLDPRFKSGVLKPPIPDRVTFAINKLSVGAAMRADRTCTFTALLKVLTSCLINGNNLPYSSTGNRMPTLDRIAGRLLLKVVTEERQKSLPFATTNLVSVLQCLHELFSIPESRNKNSDGAINVARALLKNIVEASSAPESTTELQNHLSMLPSNSPLHGYLTLLGYEFKEPTKENDYVSQSLDSLNSLSEHSKPEDYAHTARSLHSLSMSHPNIDLKPNLNRINYDVQRNLHSHIEKLSIHSSFEIENNPVQHSNASGSKKTHEAEMKRSSSTITSNTVQDIKERLARLSNLRH